MVASCGAIALWVLARRVRETPAGDDARLALARETLVRVQEVANRVAADVDEHSLRVEEINAQLSAGEEVSEAYVLSAVERLVAANQQMQRQLESAEEKLQSQAREIESNALEARTDALTQLANRRALDDELARCVAEFAHRGQTSSVMLLDVDHFKRFNDTHGHQAGDEVLRSVGKALKQSLRETALVARFGGEEFAVVFGGIPLSAARIPAERARAAIGAATIQFNGRPLHVTASAGLAELQAGESEEQILRRVDEALYAAKRAGRNCGQWHDGHTSFRLALDQLVAEQARLVVGREAGPEQLGDEWLYDPEGNPEPMYRDPVANVSSRPVFFDDLIRRIAHWRRGGSPLVLLMLQVDSYARLLSEFGPTAAAVVLRVAAQLMKATTRDMDHVSRLQEDTFALLLPGAKLADAAAIAERLRLVIERCRLPRSAGAMHFTVSIGVVEASEGDDMRRLLERSRTALQVAINQGRNIACALDPQGNVVPPAANWAARD